MSKGDGMKIRTASIALALLVFLNVPAALPFAEGSSSIIQHAQAPAAQQPDARQTGEGRRFSMRPDAILGIKETSGTLFDNAVAVLKKKYYDEKFRTEVLPKLAAEFQEKARRAVSISEQRAVVQEMLSFIPASHLGLLSKQSFRYVMQDLQGQPYPTFGFQLVEQRGKLYAFAVLEGGPAERAGLLTWDRIVSIDNVAAEKSPRLDWRTDDAYITDDRDPAVHYLTAERGNTIRVKVERHRGKFVELAIPAEDYSAFDAAKASAKVHNVGNHKIGYVHFWYVHMTGVPELLKQKLEVDFKDCDAFVLDLRGRGGNGLAIQKIIDVLRADNSARNRPMVALVDRQSRSAKDVLAYELKKTGLARVVGERTAGAVIPATFADIGYDTVLMFPSFKLPRYTDILELKPVDPDVLVERAGPLSAGADPILKAGLAEAARLAKMGSKRAGAHSWSALRLGL